MGADIHQSAFDDIPEAEELPGGACSPVQVSTLNLKKRG